MVSWEYKVGPLTLNFRVLMEPKGFLRIVLLFIALLAFSITAGFQSSSTANSLRCLGNDSNNTLQNYTATATFVYPYSAGSFSIRSNPAEGFNYSTICNNSMQFATKALSSSAEYFVAMGVFTMVYVIGALLIYIMFITPELFLAKWLVIGDFFLTIGMGVLYLIGCIAWSAGTSQLNAYTSEILEQFGISCLRCGLGDISDNTQVQNFVQPAISLIFGYLAAGIWFASIWFVYKDTVWHKDRTGPLASLYGITDKDKDTSKEPEAGGTE